MEAEEVRKQLQARAFVPDAEYDTIRYRSVRNCHDVILYLPEKKKILLAIRGQEPAKGFLWPFGGAQRLGLILEESLVKVVGKESGLKVSDLEFFGRPIDHMWSVGPKGIPVHDIGSYFTGIGEGEIRPDKNHSTRLLTPDEYFEGRDGMAHWTRVGMDEAMKRFYGIKFGEDRIKTQMPKYYVDAEPFS